MYDPPASWRGDFWPKKVRQGYLGSPVTFSRGSGSRRLSVSTQSAPGGPSGRPAIWWTLGARPGGFQGSSHWTVGDDSASVCWHPPLRDGTFGRHLEVATARG